MIYCEMVYVYYYMLFWDQLFIYCDSVDFVFYQVVGDMMLFFVFKFQYFVDVGLFKNYVYDDKGELI